MPDPRRRGRRNATPRDPLLDRRLDALKEWRLAAAERLDLEPGVVAPQRDLDLLATEMPSSPEDLKRLDEIRVWRRGEFGAEWLAVLAKVAGRKTG